MSNTKKEHYVPRFYLEKFSTLSSSKKECKIWVFNKRSQAAPYASNVKDAATSNHFYDFPVKLVGEDSYKNFDKGLQNEENWISPFIKKFEERLSHILKLDDKQKYQSRVIEKTERKKWSYILAVQILRTRKFRNLLKEVKKQDEKAKFIQNFSAQINRGEIEHIKTTFPRLKAETIKSLQNYVDKTIPTIFNKLYDDDSIAIPHYQFFSKYIHELAKIFAKYRWIIGVNRTDEPFYTSDHPVVKIPYFGTGYASEGIEILFPLNSEVILILQHKEHAKSNERDCKLLNLSKDEVKKYNEAQVYCSDQFIYCQEDKFELAQYICKKEPDLCSNVRNRVKFIKE